MIIMPLVSTLVLPHGAMPFDGDLSLEEDGSSMAAERIKIMPEELRKDCTTIFTSCRDAVDEVQKTSPEVVFLNTPHGICLSDSMGVYTNNSAKGNAEWNGQWDEYSVSVNLDLEVSEELVQHLKADGIPTEGINTFARYDSPLRWGEVIPLWYLEPILKKGLKVVIISNPLCLKRSAESVTEIAKVGRSIGKFISGLQQRVLYVCSGDLAHTHKHECKIQLYLPDPRWPALCSNVKYHASVPFDVSIENWIKALPYKDEHIIGPVKTAEQSTGVWNTTTIEEARRWLEHAFLIKNTALSCGISGFCILQGILEPEVRQGNSFLTTLFCRLAPTYYGMMAASLIKKNTE